MSPNPRAEEVMLGAECYNADECDAIVAVGGGSPIDCAKGIGIVVSGGGHILEAEGVDHLKAPMPATICVPTTGGSSADVSQFASISDPAGRRKIAIVSKAIVPDASLVDPDCLSTMDRYLAGCTVVDALTHAIEAFLVDRAFEFQRPARSGGDETQRSMPGDSHNRAVRRRLARAGDAGEPARGAGLTHMVMPGLTGHQVTERLASLNREVKVLYMSGYTENVISLQGVLKAGINYIGQ